MSKYINLNDIRIAFHKMIDEGKWLEKETSENIIRALVNLPRIEVNKRKGEWVRKGNGTYYWLECSKCGTLVPHNQYGGWWESSYCPNYGADMRDDMRDEQNNSMCDNCKYDYCPQCADEAGVENNEDYMIITDKSTLKDYIWQLLGNYGSVHLTPQLIDEITKIYTEKIIRDCKENDG